MIKYEVVNKDGNVYGTFNRDTGAALRDRIMKAWDGKNPVEIDFGGARVCFTGF